MRAPRPLRLLVAGMLLLAVAAVGVLASLVVADWREARTRQPTLARQVAFAIDHGDRLHYVVHLAAGRLADLCGCASQFAQDQYDRATWHARTGRQHALVTTARPSALEHVVPDLAGIAGSGVRWAGAAGRWLSSRVFQLA